MHACVRFPLYIFPAICFPPYLSRRTELLFSFPAISFRHVACHLLPLPAEALVEHASSINSV